MNEKPPYRLPTMADIAAITSNGFRVVSTFSGAGGSSLGYRMAGYRVVWASEFVEAAQEAYRLNHPSTPLSTKDIRQVKADEILEEAGLAAGDVDILDGSPPCSAFSTCGVGEAGWGVEKEYSSKRQRVDDLFFEFARLVRGLQPRVFVAENVPALAQGKALGYFREIMKTLKAAGYVVKARILDALWLGVPQHRRRLIFCGARQDLGAEPVFPRPKSYHYTLREVLDGLPPGHEADAWQLPRGIMRLLYDEAANPRTGGRFNTVYRRLYGGEAYFNHRRLFWDRPAYTIVQGSRSAYHPSEARSLSTAELKRVCSFPDDFEVPGTPRQQWERMGRAVPPLMMRAMAAAVRDEILQRAHG